MREVSAQPALSVLRNDEEINAALHGTSLERENGIRLAYDRYAKPLAAFIREKVAPTLDSDEVATAVSETFCGLARHVAKGKYTSAGALSTLLFSIARRKGFDQLRRKTTLKRRPDRAKDADASGEDEAQNDDLSDEEFASFVTQRLLRAPEIRELWRTAADDAAANEIIRKFRLWISTLPRLQRKVAEALLVHFGSISDDEICDELVRSGLQTTTASVGSARRGVVAKFTALIQKSERIPNS